MAREHARVGHAVAAAALQLRDDPDRLPRAPTSTACPAIEKDYLPQTEPRPPEAGPLDPVMALSRAVVAEGAQSGTSTTRVEDSRDVTAP